MMGFEQLAALKEQLAKQAKAESRAKTRRVPPKASARPAKPVDPVLQAIAKLQERFPQTFPKIPAPKVPLKIGIFKDLVQQAQELGLTEPALRDAIRTWCRGTRYWTCLVEGAARVDLAGKAAGHVAPADSTRAQGLQAQRAARALSRPATTPKFPTDLICDESAVPSARGSCADEARPGVACLRSQAPPR